MLFISTMRSARAQELRSAAQHRPTFLFPLPATRHHASSARQYYFAIKKMSLLDFSKVHDQCSRKMRALNVGRLLQQYTRAVSKSFAIYFKTGALKFRQLAALLLFSCLAHMGNLAADAGPMTSLVTPRRPPIRLIIFAQRGMAAGRAGVPCRHMTMPTPGLRASAGRGLIDAMMAIGVRLEPPGATWRALPNAHWVLKPIVVSFGGLW